MQNVFKVLIVFTTVYGLNAQVEEVNSSTLKPRLFFDDFTYPLFLDSEVHSSFLLNYRLTDNLQVELQGFYDTYILTNRFRSSLVLKQYLTNKLYLFGGIDLEMEYVKQSSTIPKRPPRLGFINGLGYDINSDFSLEAKSNIGMNQSSMGVYGETFIPMPQVYTLGGKIKF
jgi:hypothetical protein